MPEDTKKMEICSSQMCLKELKHPYTPIEVKITVKKASKKIKPEKYSGKFCSWLCMDNQVDRWIERSRHV